MKECRICNVILDGDNHSDFICDKHISSGLSRSFDGLIFNYEQQIKQLEDQLHKITLLAYADHNDEIIKILEQK